MKKLYLSILIVLAALSTTAQERVLFVGNSLTYFNVMPLIFEGIANEKGHDISVHSYTVGGTGLATLLPSEEVTRLVRNERWDKVVLQPGTSESGGQSLSTAALAQIIGQFIDMLHATSPEAKVYLYEIGYGIPPGNGNGDYNYYLMAQGIIRDTVTRIARLAGVPFAPAGECFREHYAEHHDLMLHPAFNEIHPNLAGSYLVACAIFETLYEEPVVPCRFHSTLDASQAEYLQQVADRVVLPRREEWLLGPATEEEDPDTVGIRQVDYQRLQAYPNPTTGHVHVDADGEIFIHDMLGNRQRMNASGGWLDLSQLTPGVYILQSGDRRQKLIISRP